MIFYLPLFVSCVFCFNGRLTYFAPGLGACGGRNSGSDMIVAIVSLSIFNPRMHLNMMDLVAEMCVYPTMEKL